MIRRTFAVAGAAVLAIGITGLAGPAAADDAGTVQSTPTVVISEIGVELDTTVNGQAIKGDFIELENTTGSAVPLGGWALEACNASTGLTAILLLGSSDVVPAKDLMDPNSGFFLIANDVYHAVLGAPVRDRPFASTVDGFLEQANGGVRLIDTNPDPDLVHDVKWGSPESDCATFDPAALTPTTSLSINWNGSSWPQSGPSPTNRNGDTV